jgi:hypothetical protein
LEIFNRDIPQLVGPALIKKTIKALLPQKLTNKYHDRGSGT